MTMVRAIKSCMVRCLEFFKKSIIKLLEKKIKPTIKILDLSDKSISKSIETINIKTGKKITKQKQHNSRNKK